MKKVLISFFIENDDAEAVAGEIVKLVQNNLPKYYHVEPSHIQVLTSMQRGVVGATSLNLALQEALNPVEEEIFMRGRGKVMMPKPSLRRSGFCFRAQDKVMQIKNNYDKEVFNGDIGIIESVDDTDRTLLVNFDGKSVEYDVTELDELVHAYATTIHKAQGSEYPIVVMPVLMNHYVMLQRNLIYTGITRAKKIKPLLSSYGIKLILITNYKNILFYNPPHEK